MPNPSPDILAGVAKACGIGLSQLLRRMPPGREGTLLRLVKAAAAQSHEEWRILASRAA